jgi:hypothetical protein
LADLKAVVVELGLDGTREGFKFAVLMFARYPELRSV